MQSFSETAVYGTEGDDPERSLLQAARRGFAKTCPACGKGALFNGFLKVRPNCERCGEELHHHRADDLPAYLNILVVGHVVLGAMMVLMTWEFFGMWTTMFITMAVSVIAAGVLMQPLKGMVVGTQWALRMHGFGGHDD
ncbi:DUF983 domain-containing protein [Salaquimonas pukyongi]|uniref:DUF983 domain-containing protein n=1 Tax=Salaquimonas pukyongi TaxID=2712698 RepID=UPI00096B6E98|nr:DUF983 domain-containing protein [Salaquimonas pukyongi]